ncbi:MAG: retropepsin-like aspartic protease [Gallionella sp.]|nr:retropepsin-like aspartic protease [Gallionella sp.]
MLGKLIIWLAVGGCFYMAFDSYQRQHQSGGQVSLGLTVPFGLACESLPPNGKVSVLDPSIARRSDAIYSGFKFVSDLPKPVVVLISDTELNSSYQLVAIHPKQSAQVQLPVGSYGMTILSGDTWCNPKKGFVNGTRTSINPFVEVKAGATGSMLMRPNGAAYNLALSYQTLTDQLAEKMPKEVLGSGFMELRRGQNGNYSVMGKVNSTQIEFMVDTGASLTSISQLTAQQAGIYQCDQRQFYTANGEVWGCVGVARQLVFGNFTIKNVEVAIMPRLRSSALLGMNVLSMVRIEQQGNVMRISAQ